jgi:hypothetical protein
MTDCNTENLWDEGFEEYRQFMYDNCEMILGHRIQFLKDSYFTPSFKLERIKELIDFFELEEEYEKCKDLETIKDALEIKHLFVEIYEKSETIG